MIEGEYNEEDEVADSPKGENWESLENWYLSLMKEEASTLKCKI